jgi:hypothetical protein
MTEIISFPYEDNISIEIPLELDKHNIKTMKFISTNEPHLIT